MIYKEGDTVEKWEKEKEYFKQCIMMKKLHDDLEPGDEVLTYRDNLSKVIRRLTFIEFGPCQFQNSRSHNVCCRCCKGYLLFSGTNPHMCSGYTENGLSCILKVIKNRAIPLLKKEMFELWIHIMKKKLVKL